MYAVVARTHLGGFKATLGKWQDAPPRWKYRPRRWIPLSAAEVVALGIQDYKSGDWNEARFSVRRLPDLVLRLRAAAVGMYGDLGLEPRRPPYGPSADALRAGPPSPMPRRRKGTPRPGWRGKPPGPRNLPNVDRMGGY